MNLKQLFELLILMNDPETYTYSERIRLVLRRLIN